VDKRHRYTAEELRFLERHIAGRRYAELAEMFNQRFGLDLTVRQISSTAGNHGLYNGMPSGPPCGIKAFNRRAEGYELITAKGDVLVKTGGNAWVRKSRLVWEKAQGPIPKGHRVIFADGNKQNFDLDNLLLATPREIGVMNMYGLMSGDAGLTRAGKAIADIKILLAAHKRGDREAVKRLAAEIKAGGKQ
jgi:hypothetical protein